MGKKRTKEAKIAAGLIEALEKSGVAVGTPPLVSEPKNTIHTGSYMLDLLLCGGWYKARMYTFFGPSNGGKTTLMQECIRAAQRSKHKPLILHEDVENATDGAYIRRQGVNVDYKVGGEQGYIYVVPEFGEDAYRAMCNFLDALPDDPDPAGPPRALLFCDGYNAMESEKAHKEKNPVGLLARMHSRWQRKLRKALKRPGATLIATNQVSTHMNNFSSYEDETAGNALRFYPDVRVKVSSSKPGDKGCPPGVSVMKFVVKKCKVAGTTGWERTTRLVVGRGVDRLYDRLMFLSNLNYIVQVGNKYEIEGKKYPLKKAREIMKDKEWIKLCRKLRTDISVYEEHYGYGELMQEDWG